MTTTDEQALIADLKAAQEAIKPPCDTCTQLERMTDEVAATMKRALDAPQGGRIGHKKLARIMTRAGFPVGERAVIFHRSGHTARRA